ncbi:MAG: AbrB family transcriptional regulator [Rhodospirillales bacterium]
MKLPENFTPRIIAKIAATLLLGAIGGVIADYLTLPMPWLIGALLITLGPALSGTPLQNPKRLRFYAASALGVMLGSGFTPEIFNQAAQWPISLTTILLHTVVVGGLIVYCLNKLTKLGFVNSFFGAAPGGLVEMVLLAREYGGDEKRVSLMHSTRLMLTVLIIPIFYRLYYGYTPAARAAGLEAHGDIGLFDAAVLIGCGVIGYWGAKKMNVPAYQIFGPLFLSAFVHITGITSAHIPNSLIVIAQIIFGTALGCSFLGISLRDVTDTFATSAAMTFTYLALAAASAFGLEYLTGLPFKTLFLIFSPGGLPEMTLISLSLNIDIAFVTTHHAVRVVFLLFIVPVLFYWIAPRFGIAPHKKHD